MSEATSLNVRLKTRGYPEVLAVAVVVVLAAATRLYKLASFPYFPPQWPWLGDHAASACPAGVSGVWPGLYRDEMSRLCEIAFFPHALTTYEPSINIVFVKVSQFLLGMSNFADRLPTALASILTAVVIYFAAKQLYKSRSAALVSSLYFIAMVPAIVYGRMIYYENLVGLFLVVAIYCVARFEDTGVRRWLYLAALASAFAVLSKESGLFVLLFFTLWAVTGKGVRSKVVPVLLAWAPVAAGGVLLLSLAGSVGGALSKWGFAYAGRELAFQFLFLQSMPSGYVAFDTGYIKPEFWYIFAYLCLAALLIAGSRAGKLLAEALFVFMATMVVAYGQGMASYYVIMLFPVLALAVGGAVPYLKKVGAGGALALYAALFIPLDLSYVASISLPTIAVNFSLYVLKDALLVAPLVSWLVLEGASRALLKRHFPLVVVVLVSFFVLLLVGTPELYSYYFLNRAP